MQINFYSNFSKRINSTKRPSSGSTTIEGRLKEACSIENPVVTFDLGLTNAPSYIYAYIPEFSRYYFVSDWSFIDGLWECSLDEDYLASWKTNIGATNAYIDRSASAYNGNIIDTTYITGTNVINQSVPFTHYDVFNYSISSGCFILGIIDSNNQTDSQVGGAVTYYVLTPAQCKNLMHYLLDDDFLEQNGFPSIQTITQDISQEMAKAFVKPIDFIVSCMWYPLPTNAFTNASDISITVGYWAISTSIATGKLLQAGVFIDTAYATIPAHPQAETRGDYLNYAPYTRLNVELAPFGNIPIDTSFRTQGNILYCFIYIDPITGASLLHVHICDSVPYGNEAQEAVRKSPVVYETSAQFGVPIQLSQVNGDYVNFASEAVQAVSSIDLLGGSIGMMTGGVAGAIKGAINKDVVTHTANAITSLAPQVRGVGLNGSRTLIYIPPVLSMQFMPLVDEDNEELGRPLREKRVINTLSGFVKCFEVTVDYPCYISEKEKILAYLLSGFFYE